MSEQHKRVIAIEEDTELVRVRSEQPSFIRIHVYLGTICRSEMFDKSRDFNDNKHDILDRFGIGSKLQHEEQKQEREKYIFKLVNGGHVDANNLVFHDDRVIILPREDYLKQQEVKQEEGVPLAYKNLSELKLKHLKTLFSKKPDEEDDVKTEDGDNSSVNHQNKTETQSNAASERIKYKFLLKKKPKHEGDEKSVRVETLDMSRENAQNGTWQDTDHIVKKIDYDNLELSLFRRRVADYHDLLEHVNIWAVSLGFLVKLKRPPKFNADGSKTLRVYCQSFSKSKPLPPSAATTGLNSTMKDQDANTQSSAQTTNSTVQKCCNFALTFKSNTKTDCWLLYQEFSKEQMQHSHCLEWETFKGIREYVQQYNDKVRSLVEMKDMIYEKFGLEYTINQISYFKGKWTAEAMLIQKDQIQLLRDDDDYSNLIKLLKKCGDDCLEFDYDAQDGNLKFLFYSSLKMKELYLKHSDITFINKRFTVNRFKRPLIMIFVVTNTGQSQLVAFALYEKEETAYFARIQRCFNVYMSQAPRVMIIERQLKLYQALKEELPTTTILFCYFHILKTLKTQYQFLEKDRPSEYKQITDLPLIDTKEEFNKALSAVAQLKYSNDYHALIVQKLQSEQDKMTKYTHLQHFTGGVSICQRNEQLKQYLKPALKKRDCSVAEILKRLLSCGSKEFKLTQEYQNVSQKHDQLFLQAKFLGKVKDMCHQYGYQRVKWNIARGFRYQVSLSTETSWQLERKSGGSDWEAAKYTVHKVIANGKLTAQCECGESKNTGFPCGHVCLLNYKGLVEEMEIHERWWKGAGEKSKKEVVVVASKSLKKNKDIGIDEKAAKERKGAELEDDEETSMEESEVIRV